MLGQHIPTRGYRVVISENTTSSDEPSLNLFHYPVFIHRTRLRNWRLHSTQRFAYGLLRQPGVHNLDFSSLRCWIGGPTSSYGKERAFGGTCSSYDPPQAQHSHSLPSRRPIQLCKLRGSSVPRVPESLSHTSCHRLFSLSRCFLLSTSLAQASREQPAHQLAPTGRLASFYACVVTSTYTRTSIDFRLQSRDSRVSVRRLSLIPGPANVLSKSEARWPIAMCYHPTDPEF